MQKPKNFDQVVRNITFAADNAIVDVQKQPLIVLIRIAVEAALTSAIVNGMIEIKPESDWVQWQSVEVAFDSDNLEKD